jgi:hypothetical protein
MYSYIGLNESFLASCEYICAFHAWSSGVTYNTSSAIQQHISIPAILTVHLNAPPQPHRHAMNRHSNLFLPDMLPPIQHEYLRVGFVPTRILLNVILVRLPAFPGRRQVRRSPFIEVIAIVNVSTALLRARGSLQPSVWERFSKRKKPMLWLIWDSQIACRRVRLWV